MLDICSLKRDSNVRNCGKELSNFGLHTICPEFIKKGQISSWDGSILFLLLLCHLGFSPYTLAYGNKYVNIYININKYRKKKSFYLLLSGTSQLVTDSNKYINIHMCNMSRRNPRPNQNCPVNHKPTYK